MYLKDLENNKVVCDLVKQIINDDVFRNSCELYCKQILDDGTITKEDIPLLVNLCVVTYNNYNKIKVSKKLLKPVFMLLLTKILGMFESSSELDENLLLLLLEPHIDLLLMSISMSNCKWPCCGSKQDNKLEYQEMVYKNLKLTKMKSQENTIVRP